MEKEASLNKKVTSLCNDLNHSRGNIRLNQKDFFAKKKAREGRYANYL